MVILAKTEPDALNKVMGPFSVNAQNNIPEYCARNNVRIQTFILLLDPNRHFYVNINV